MSDRLYNRNFLFLWQGQLVSSLGDAVYRLALGFWILATTGSTAVMGGVMAASVVPRVLLSPLTGTLADRTSRKALLVLSDAVAGVSVLLLGIAALTGTVELWMVFTVAVVLGGTTALFNPAVTAAMAELVPKRKLIQANSAFAVLATGAAMIGNMAGGVLYQALGAAWLFLFNGLSFLVSALSELGLRVPPVVRPAKAPPLWRDLGQGFAMIWQAEALRTAYLGTALSHFFSTAVFVLLLPLFHTAPELGAANYGWCLGSLSVGAFGGFLAMSAVPVVSRRRCSLLVVLGVLQAACFGVLPWLGSVVLMLPAMALAGFAISVQDSLITTALQLAIPDGMRGKAFGLRAALMLALGAVAMAAAGGVAELVAPAVLVSIAAVGIGTGVLVLSVVPSTRRLLNAEPVASDAPSAPQATAEEDGGVVRRKQDPPASLV